jgi:iduronate 2-sulfatase
MSALASLCGFRGQRVSWKNAASALLVWFFVTVALSGAAYAATKPNVLFIAVDDLRPELGTYGASYIKSPNIDRLAERGVRFERAYCQYAICGPSRASLLTGLRPDTLKIEHIDTFFRDTVRDVVTLPQYFRQNGYTTVYTGKIFHGRQTDDANSWTRPATPAPTRASAAQGEYQLPESRAIVEQRREDALKRYGSTDMQGMGGGPACEAAEALDNAYPDGRTTESAIATLREIKDGPFFLGVGFLKPHLPFVAPQKYFDLYDPATLPLAEFRGAPTDAPTIARHSSFELRTRTGVPTSGPIDEATARRLMHGYAACVSFIDAQVGRLLDELDRLGLRENTIVVFWGDHGWHLGEFGIWGKATNHEIATRVPLIVSAPETKARSKGARGLVELVDVYPTLCDLAGLPLPPHLEGESFRRLLDAPELPGKPAAFSQFPSPALREWAARPLGNAMRRTFFGPLIGEVEAQLQREHGQRYDADIFNNHLMGYSLRVDRYRFTAWVDRRHPDAEPYAMELYDHTRDSNERENLSHRPENRLVVDELRAKLMTFWRGEHEEERRIGR